MARSSRREPTVIRRGMRATANVVVDTPDSEETSEIESAAGRLIRAPRRLIERSIAAHTALPLGTRLLSLMHARHPILVYRAFAFVVAVIIIESDLHAASSMDSDLGTVLAGVVHFALFCVTFGLLRRLPARHNVAWIAADMAASVYLLANTGGWEGPFWLYSLAAVFWPSVRFGLRGALASVLVFHAAVFITQRDAVSQAFDDGLGGDLVARILMSGLIAGAIALTARALTTNALLAAEAERNRIARDLHDGVGKTMGGISMEASSLAQWIERDPEEAQRRARYVSRISGRAASEVRDVIRGLRRNEATTALVPDVQALVEEWSATHDATLFLQINGTNVQFPVLIHGEVMRMLHEFLTNVDRHAQARQIWVRLTLSSNGVTLAVRDDGSGFDTQRLDPWADEGHFGLLGARERASMLGGHFQLESHRGRGTEVTVDLPLSPREERAVHVLR